MDLLHTIAVVLIMVVIPVIMFASAMLGAHCSSTLLDLEAKFIHRNAVKKQARHNKNDIRVYNSKIVHISDIASDLGTDCESLVQQKSKV